MTDLEITKLCAEAMGLTRVEGVMHNGVRVGFYDPAIHYRPLHDDAQAMALVKKFKLQIETHYDGDGWWLAKTKGSHSDLMCSNLNRAICKCVAETQKAKP